MPRDKGYSTTNGLMRHLRSSGISINGSYQKRQLVNFGYFHGYKGYRFFKNITNRIPFSDYKEVIAVMKHDNNMKAMFYPYLMFIETALKNITLEIILEEADSHLFNVIFDKLMPGYIGAPTGTPQQIKQKMQSKKLEIQNKIHYSLQKAYDLEKRIVTHFYHGTKYSDVPIWAIFETLSLGDFGKFVSCLNQPTRRLISNRIDLNLSGDTNITLIYQIIYIIKDLRNAVAHNDVVFDTRYRNTTITRPIQVCLVNDVGIRYVNFEQIIDYLILVCYILKNLKVPKQEILSLITSFEKSLNDLHRDVNATIYAQIVHPDTVRKISDLRNFIKA